jgi:hypothetical protein
MWSGPLPAKRYRLSNVAAHVIPSYRNFYSHPWTFAIAPEPRYLRLYIPKSRYEMASTSVPRAAIRCLSRTTPSLRTKTSRVATRCLHQNASPITTSPLQHRPRVQRWAQTTTPIAATVSRRTMFIQTEPTPNADVCALPPSTPSLY